MKSASLYINVLLLRPEGCGSSGRGGYCSYKSEIYSVLSLSFLLSFDHLLFSREAITDSLGLKVDHMRANKRIDVL